LAAVVVRKSMSGQPFTSAFSGLLGALRIPRRQPHWPVFQERVELLSVEVKEEKVRLVQIFIWISAAVFTAMMMLAFASLTVVYLFPEGATGSPPWADSLLFYAGVLVAILVAFRRFLANLQPKPFAATLQELQKDRACIQSKT
jgi:uncharacterized membrane protein YqjE